MFVVANLLQFQASQWSQFVFAREAISTQMIALGTAWLHIEADGHLTLYEVLSQETYSIAPAGKSLQTTIHCWKQRFPI